MVMQTWTNARTQVHRADRQFMAAGLSYDRIWLHQCKRQRGEHKHKWEVSMGNTHTHTNLITLDGDECGLILWLECSRWEGSDLLLRAISYRPKVQPDGIPRYNECIYSYAGNRISPKSIHRNNISFEFHWVTSKKTQEGQKIIWLLESDKCDQTWGCKTFITFSWQWLLKRISPVFFLDADVRRGKSSFFNVFSKLINIYYVIGYIWLRKK